MTFTPHEIGKRVVATFIQAGTAALMAAGITGDAATAALTAGLAAVVTLVHRLSSRWLEDRGDV